MVFFGSYHGGIRRRMSEYLTGYCEWGNIFFYEGFGTCLQEDIPGCIIGL